MKYLILLVLLYIIPIVLCNDSSSLLVPDSEDNDDDNQKGMFNFASHAAGAVILDKSPSNAKGFSNLLNDDKDKYAIAACSEKKWVVIGLSEDILVKTVVVSNYEKYSSQLKNFQLLASTSFPTDQWINLGTYEAEARLGEQVFDVNNSSSHTRYLKFKFMTHYDDEALCTLSQIKVHGTTVIASFQEEVKISEATMRDMLSQLNLDETIQKSDEKNESDSSSISSIPSSLQETENQQNVSIESNFASIEIIDSTTTLIDSNSINSDNLDQSKSTEYVDDMVTITSNENETSIIDTNDGTIKVEAADIEQIDLLSEAAHVNVSHPSAVDHINDIVTSKNADEGSTLLSNNATAEEIKAPVITTDIKESSSDNEVEHVPSDDKVANETIQSPEDTSTSDNSTLNEDVITSQEDKGPSLMQTIAESTVHAVKEIVLAPLRQIPKPKIQHGKHQTSSGPLNEVQENLFGIASKNDEEEQVVTPDKLVTDIKDIDKHHVHNRHHIRNSSPNEIATQSNDSIVTDSVDIEASGSDDDIKTVKSEAEHLPIIENVEKITKNSTEVTSDAEQSITGEIESETVVNSEPSPSPIHSNVSSVDNVSIASSLLEIDEKGDIDLNSTVIIETETANASTTILTTTTTTNDTDKVSVIQAIDLNVSISENVTVSSTDVFPDIENDKNVKATAVSSAVISISTNNVIDNNGTNIIDAIDVIEERKSNDSVITKSKKTPILQTTSSKASSSPPLPTNCLETLKFVDFQAKMVAKLVNASDDKDRSVPLTSQDNVFRHLMQKIKMLEMNYAIIEMYSIQIGDCYRTVLSDLSVNVTTSLQLASSAASSAAVSAEVLTNISYNRPLKYDNLKLTGGNGIINKDRDKVIIDGLENILLRYNEDDVIQLIAVALILGLLSLFVSCAIGLFTFFQLRKHYSK